LIIYINVRDKPISAVEVPFRLVLGFIPVSKTRINWIWYLPTMYVCYLFILHSFLNEVQHFATHFSWRIGYPQSASSFITCIEHRYAVVLLDFSGPGATFSLMWSRDLCDWFVILLFFSFWVKKNAWQSVELHLIKCANRLKGQICKKPTFFGVLWDCSCYVQSLYSLPYENIVFNDKVCLKKEAFKAHL
jgi:hypothetical protein